MTSDSPVGDTSHDPRAPYSDPHRLDGADEEPGLEPRWLPVELDTSVPHSARVYDFWLGGKNNYRADRLLAEKILVAIPRQRRHVRANRAFLVRVVEHLVRDLGVRQIIDVGAGLPTSPNVHEVAQEIAPETRVVYVDNDPIVMAHARALMPSTCRDTVGFVHGDLRNPGYIISHPSLRRLIDPAQPVAVLVLAMLMSLTDGDDPVRVVADLMGPLAPGSYLAATHTTADFDPLAMAEHVRAAAEAGMRFTPRSEPEVGRFFDGLELVEPGVVPVLAWRPNGPTPVDPRSIYIYAGLGRKPHVSGGPAIC